MPGTKIPKISTMYKSIEIANIIGSSYSVGKDTHVFPIEKMDIVISEVRTRDQFIRIENKYKSLVHIEEIVCSDDVITETEIVIPDNLVIRNKFEREFYRLDLETRRLLSDIVKNIL